MVEVDLPFVCYGQASEYVANGSDSEFEWVVTCTLKRKIKVVDPMEVMLFCGFLWLKDLTMNCPNSEVLSFRLPFFEYLCESTFKPSLVVSRNKRIFFICSHTGDRGDMAILDIWILLLDLPVAWIAKVLGLYLLTCESISFYVCIKSCMHPFPSNKILIFREGTQLFYYSLWMLSTYE